MPTPNPQTKFNYEDYQLFPDDGKRHELIDGDHYVTPSPKTKHQRVSSNLLRILGSFVYDRRLGQVFAAPIDVVLSDLDFRLSDVIFIRLARASVATENNIHG